MSEAPERIAHSDPSAPVRTAVRWPVPAALAIPALVAALVITFSSDHSARFGLTVFAGYAIVAGLAALVGVFLLGKGVMLVGATIKTVIGISASGLALLQVLLGFDAGSRADAAGALSVTAGGMLLIFGLVDLAVGIQSRREDRFGRDWITVGVIQLLGAVAMFLVPTGWVQPFTGPDGIDRELDAAIMITGLSGAAYAIVGVYLAIAAVSLLPGRKTPAP